MSNKLTEEDLLPFRQFIAKCTKNEAEIPTGTQDLLSLYTSIVCAYLGSMISYKAHFMNVESLAETVRLMVKKDETEKAKEILQDLNLAITGTDLRKDSGDSENGNE